MHLWVILKISSHELCFVSTVQGRDGEDAVVLLSFERFFVDIIEMITLR